MLRPYRVTFSGMPKSYGHVAQHDGGTVGVSECPPNEVPSAEKPANGEVCRLVQLMCSAVASRVALLHFPTND
jgi:hypothetical protein